MKTILKYMLLFLLFFSGIRMISAQDASGIPGHERIVLFTDRTMYITGEKILFAAIVCGPGLPSEIPASKVLYCELVTPDGFRAASGKYLLDGARSAGCLLIPKDASSGTYYLKAYTKSMRNSGPAIYHYTRLIIINPVREEILPSESGDSAACPDEIFSSDGPPGTFDVSSDKLTYLKREKVSISITGVPSSENPAGLLCLSVVPDLSFTGCTVPVPGKKANGDTTAFYPETRGISLTGRVQDKMSGEPLPGVKVNLSVIGDKDFMATRTDSSGSFYFSLEDHTGNRDIFICSEQVAGFSPKIMVDNDFCTRQPGLPSPPFILPEATRKTALDMAMNQRISSLFRNDSVISAAGPPLNDRPFYGEPSQVLILDKYIDLPTLEEYFNELPMGVKVRRQQGKKYFRFYSEQTEMVIFDPLVLVDWVAVDDIERILALSPRDIARIELVEDPYTKGQIMYGGIISFVSKKNDFAGIDLPISGTFINYDFFGACEIRGPEGQIPANIPDGRNTAFWIPEITLDPGGKTSFTFPAPDTPGSWIILLRGVGQDGREFRVSARFEIM